MLSIMHAFNKGQDKSTNNDKSTNYGISMSLRFMHSKLGYNTISRTAWMFH